MSTSKPRIVKDYDKLDTTVKEQIKLEYPYGFEDYLVTFTNAEGRRVSALPFETEDRYYLVRMTVAEAQAIIEDDDDYDEDGNLTDEAREEIEDRLDDADVEVEDDGGDDDDSDNADDDADAEDDDDDDRD
ncbi:MAG: hypothetical protein H6601_09040 [Flavobacteriales bacterium]|nr:hypothetical protein [Flavobacteriales bacterium]MCB9204250.1 hypothetical protein [Flavobacteriales bacterium]